MKTLAFFLLFTTSAHALSCMAPDPIHDYTYARDSKDLYSMVIGQITPYGPINVPKQELDSNQTVKAATTRVRLTGRALTAEGFTAAYDRDITLSLNCLSIWCPGPPATSTEVFVSLRHEGNARIADFGPCASNALPWTADDEARILNCHHFGKCEPRN